MKRIITALAALCLGLAQPAAAQGEYLDHVRARHDRAGKGALRPGVGAQQRERIGVPPGQQGLDGLGSRLADHAGLVGVVLWRQQPGRLRGHGHGVYQLACVPATAGLGQGQHAHVGQGWIQAPRVHASRGNQPLAIEGAEHLHTDAVGRELVVGQFGLVPPWVKSASDAKLRSTKLVNARSETVTTSNNLREAWLAGQRCIVPMMAFFEDDFRSGKAVPTRISRVDGQPMGVAGLWESWTGAGGETIVSYTLLTVNANSHALMHRYQQPGSEKRMPAVLNEGGYDAWLNAAHPEKAREFLRAYPANWLHATPVQKK